ncbi:hypothetical protein PMKS-000700 [Pichia membranifaciens]|uniref:Uncharacterized protein n=1 Tax=Pichia membranifaciens TaxID=4926 RepID=A0A1Q2YCE4_9ASCO|nr:hypothetical protein PMKS-000700 [Pichia membranifaciens]
MDFDPLEFFEPGPELPVEDTDNENVGNLHNDDIAKVEANSNEVSAEKIPENGEDTTLEDTIYTIRLQVIDLPLVNASLPVEILSTLLKLFQPDQTKNFGQTSQSTVPSSANMTTSELDIEGLSKDILLYEPALTEDKIGNITWGASLELAKQIVNGNNSIWLPKDTTALTTPILELGAGTGLVTIVLGLLGYRVVSTDLPEIVDNLSKNIELNQLECVKSDPSERIVIDSLVHVTSLDWRAPNEFLNRTSYSNGYKTVLLSDPVYSTSHPYWVKDAVSAVLSRSENAHVVFMVGRRDRFEDVRECLWQLMSDLGLKLISSQIVDGFDDYGTLQYDYKVYGRKDD